MFSNTPKNILMSRGLAPKKSFGQNFMMDQRVNLAFADACRTLGQDLPIIEIGAGTGSLTKHLLKFARPLHAIERDRDLVPILQNEFKEFIANGQLVIHEADGARFFLPSVLSNNSKGLLVGNLPYHLTSTVLMLLLEHRTMVNGGVFLVQKEVADRLIAKPDSKEYGFLTVILSLAFTVTKEAQVDKSAFWPSPKIDSAIVKFAALDSGLSLLPEISAFIVFVRTIFQKRRKKLATILAGTMDRTKIIAMGINPDERPEDIAPDKFLELFMWHQQP